MDYSEYLVDYYLHPRNKGKIDRPSASAVKSNPLCGDTVSVELRISKAGKVETARFSGTGCAISSASASILMEHFEGKSTREIKGADGNKVRALLGIEISPAREKCALVALEALKTAVSDYEKKKGKVRRK